MHKYMNMWKNTSEEKWDLEIQLIFSNIVIRFSLFLKTKTKTRQNKKKGHLNRLYQNTPPSSYLYKPKTKEGWLNHGQTIILLVMPDQNSIATWLIKSVSLPTSLLWNRYTIFGLFTCHPRMNKKAHTFINVSS